MNIFILEVVEAWLCDIDRLPKLSPANSRLNNRDLSIHITRETTRLHPSTGEYISPPLGGETVLSALFWQVWHCLPPGRRNKKRFAMNFMHPGAREGPCREKCFPVCLHYPDSESLDWEGEAPHE